MDFYEISAKSSFQGAVTNLKIQPIRIEDELLRLDIHMGMMGQLNTNGLTIELPKKLE